jgi:tricarballylate dehydrogenase
MYGVYRADSVAGVAAALGLDPPAVEATIAAYNAGVPADAGTRFDPSRLDGVGTTGIAPSKSNWAQRIDTPPFYGIAVEPGITFTYMGVKVNASGQVLLADGTAMDNVFAAGEIMSGNVLSSGYLAGFGMTIGTVWGRISGREAARHALR